MMNRCPTVPVAPRIPTLNVFCGWDVMLAEILRCSDWVDHRTDSGTKFTRGRRCAGESHAGGCGGQIRSGKMHLNSNSAVKRITPLVAYTLIHWIKMMHSLLSEHDRTGLISVEEVRILCGT